MAAARTTREEPDHKEVDVAEVALPKRLGRRRMASRDRTLPPYPTALLVLPGLLTEVKMTMSKPRFASSAQAL
jgi:hypothetical protein